MNPVMCEFDEGKPHETPAEYMVSKRNEAGNFNRQQPLCHEHFVIYALSYVIWMTNRGKAVCHFHLEQHTEFDAIALAPFGTVCYFCRGGR